jgi:hypothetical protein
LQVVGRESVEPERKPEPEPEKQAALEAANAEKQSELTEKRQKRLEALGV